MSSLRLTEIWIYPVKSLGGVRVKSARVMEKGLEFDRRWMLIDDDNNFMTQRFNPKMALFKWIKVGGQWRVGFQGEYLEFSFQEPFMPLQESPIRAVIWDDVVDVQEVSKEFSAWFSARLGLGCRLVAFPEKNVRPVDSRYQINREHVSLADAYPLLIIGEQSLADLNARMVAPLPMNRFRPNLVFSGGQAFDEDNWRNFSVGKNKFAAVKPCARCVLTTVNQDTGEKGIEPLVTLSRYRKKENKVLFGQNVIALSHDEIYEGDEIIVE